MRAAASSPRIIEFIRPGDVLVVSKLDRLGRNTRDVLNLVHELDEKGACLRVLEPAIDTCGPMGRMIMTVLGMVAEMELGFIRDRQRAGIEEAKAKGVYKGRPVKFDRARILELRKPGHGRDGDRQSRRLQARRRLPGAQSGGVRMQPPRVPLSAMSAARPSGDASLIEFRSFVK